MSTLTPTTCQQKFLKSCPDSQHHYQRLRRKGLASDAAPFLHTKDYRRRSRQDLMAAICTWTLDDPTVIKLIQNLAQSDTFEWKYPVWHLGLPSAIPIIEQVQPSNNIVTNPTAKCSYSHDQYICNQINAMNASILANARWLRQLARNLQTNKHLFTDCSHLADHEHLARQAVALADTLEFSLVKDSRSNKPAGKFYLTCPDQYCQPFHLRSSLSGSGVYTEACARYQWLAQSKNAKNAWRLCGFVGELFEFANAIRSAKLPNQRFPIVSDWGEDGLEFDFQNLLYKELDSSIAIAYPRLTLNRQRRVAILTGANDDGKSTLIRALIENIREAQMAMALSVTNGKMTLCDQIYTNIGVNDNIINTSQGHFRSHARRVIHFLKNGSRHSLGAFDELYHDTGEVYKLALGWATVKHTAELGLRAVFAVHDTTLPKIETHNIEDFKGRFAPTATNQHSTLDVPSNGGVFNISMHPRYELRDGPVLDSKAFDIMESEGAPEALLREARRIKEVLETPA